MCVFLKGMTLYYALQKKGNKDLMKQEQDLHTVVKLMNFNIGSMIKYNNDGLYMYY